MTQPAQRNADYGPNHGTTPKARSNGQSTRVQDRTTELPSLEPCEAAAAPSTRADNDAALLTPDEAAQFLKVSAEQIRTLIRRGVLSAVNVGTGKSRPLYRIPRKALEEFLAGRTLTRVSAHSPQFKRRPPVPDHFAHLQ